MKYAVIKVSNGTFQIASEWVTLEKAIVNFHSVCTTLWNAEDVKTGSVAIVDEQMQTVRIEQIKHAEQE